MNYDKKIQDIIDQTGLKYDYIRKCLKELEEVFEPLTERGENNSILFNSNALIIFDQVKQLKEQGFGLKNIRSKLVSSLESNQSEQVSKPIQTEPQTDLIKSLLTDLKEANKRVLESKDEVIQTQRNQIQTLENQVLLLTDGRRPEEVRKEHEDLEIELSNQNERVFDLEEEVKNKSVKILAFEKMNDKKSELLTELMTLEGKWFKSKQRKAILEELATLK